VTEKPTLWAEASVSVEDKDIVDLSLVLRQGVRIHGRVAFDGPSAKPTADQLVRIPIVVRAVGHNLYTIPLSRIESDGQFQTAELPPGKYAVFVLFSALVQQGLPPWTLRSVALAGRDIPTQLIEVGHDDIHGVVITLEDRRTELSGTVRDEQGRVNGDAVVYAFPKDLVSHSGGGLDASTPQRFMVVRVTRAGGYYVAGLLPGQYLVAARVGEPPADWKSSETLSGLQKIAVSVTLGEGRKQTLDLLYHAGR
jgi:hypothetical protein